MKKLIATGLVLAMSLSAGAAFAAGKPKAKKEAVKKVECQVGDQKVMTASINECIKKGGLVLNYPGPSKDAPKAKKGK
ncbi:MAG: hypothetical protein ACOZEN_10015 [Thermodesulfobacteriota bacterium]